MSKTPARKQVLETPRFPDRADLIKRDILKVATGEFAAEGYHGARIDQIAKQTRTSKRMIYYYFGSKDGLYEAVLAEAYGRWRDAKLSAGAERLPPSWALAEIVGATFDYLGANPDFVRLVTGENIRNAEGLKAVPGIEELGRRMLGPLEGICQRGIANGDFRADLQALDLQMSISALCFFQVANRHTFTVLHKADMTSPAAVRARRENVIAMVLDFAKSDGAAASTPSVGVASSDEAYRSPGVVGSGPLHALLTGAPAPQTARRAAAAHRAASELADANTRRVAGEQR